MPTTEGGNSEPGECLEQKGDKPGEVRLVRCPFCGDDLDGRDVPDHLAECEAFADAWA